MIACKRVHSLTLSLFLYIYVRAYVRAYMVYAYSSKFGVCAYFFIHLSQPFSHPRPQHKCYDFGNIRMKRKSWNPHIDDMMPNKMRNVSTTRRVPLSKKTYASSDAKIMLVHIYTHFASFSLSLLLSLSVFGFRRWSCSAIK